MKTKFSTDTDGFAQVYLVNDWGSRGYFTKVNISDAGTVSLRDQDNGFKLGPTEKVRVKWPGGQITTQKIESETIYVGVSDMGSNYDVKTERLFIPVKYKGINLKIPLEDVRIKFAK